MTYKQNLVLNFKELNMNVFTMSKKELNENAYIKHFFKEEIETGIYQIKKVLEEKSIELEDEKVDKVFYTEPNKLILELTINLMEKRNEKKDIYRK